MTQPLRRSARLQSHTTATTSVSTPTEIKDHVKRAPTKKAGKHARSIRRGNHAQMRTPQHRANSGLLKSCLRTPLSGRRRKTPVRLRQEMSCDSPGVTFSPKLVTRTEETYSANEYDRTYEMPEIYACNACSRFFRGDRYSCSQCDDAGEFDVDLCAPCYEEYTKPDSDSIYFFPCRHSMKTWTLHAEEDADDDIDD